MLFAGKGELGFFSATKPSTDVRFWVGKEFGLNFCLLVFVARGGSSFGWDGAEFRMAGLAAEDGGPRSALPPTKLRILSGTNKAQPRVGRPLRPPNPIIGNLHCGGV